MTTIKLRGMDACGGVWKSALNNINWLWLLGLILIHWNFIVLLQEILNIGKSQWLDSEYTWTFNESSILYSFEQ